MELFSNGVFDFLNTLDTNLPRLLHDKTFNIIKNDILSGVNVVILYNNEFAILNRIAFTMVKQNIGISTIGCRASLMDASNEENGEFILSDYHMEFDLCEESLQYIKKLIKNQCINGKQYIFIIKNANNNINRNLYLELRRLIDTNIYAKWIITVSSYAFFEKSLLSRAVTINCCFPLSNIIKVTGITLDETSCRSLFVVSKGNIITFLELAYGNKQSMLWQDAFDTVMEKVLNEKKEIAVIDTIRNFVYKVFHVGVSIAELCHYVIFKYGETVQPLIGFIADCEYQGRNGRDCLVYEKMILGLYKCLLSQQKLFKKETKCKSKGSRTK